MAKEQLDADTHYAVTSFAMFLMVGVTWAWSALGLPPLVLLAVFGVIAVQKFWLAWRG